VSYTPYLASVAEALMKRVSPHVEDARARDALEACVRAIAGIGLALDVASPETVAALPLPAGMVPAAPLAVNDPPENLAASHETASRIAAAADWLREGSWMNNPSARETMRAMLGWERAIIAEKIARIYAIEDQSTKPEGDLVKLLIDRDRLESYCQEKFGPTAAITSFRQAVGGRSRQTAVFTLEGTDLPCRLVVQRDHPASITRDGIGQQYPVLALLAETRLKVSRPLLLENDRAILGAPFMIIEAAEGVVAGADYFRPPQNPELALELAEQLAILHAVDPAPLAGQLRRTNQDGWAGELEGLEAAWHRFAHAPSLAISAAFAWMRARVGAIGHELAIVHNDAAFHNILIQDGHFSALLDFELVHLGHPAEDLGYCRPFVEEMTDWNAFVDAYVAAGGQRFPADVLDYFSLRGGIHLLTLLQYGRDVFKSGATSDINLAEAATAFTPKHHGRITRMVEKVLERKEALF
jgi:aminoglycoside phosphotransferase (APT) family kinase protein